jgi:hypothetical protein
MVKLRRILRDYQEAGSLNGLALWGVVDDATFLTKAGHLGLVYTAAGVDYECLDHSQRRDVVHRYEAALRCLAESCRVYQYLTKRAMGPIEAAPCRQPVVQEAVHGGTAARGDLPDIRAPAARRDEIDPLFRVYRDLKPSPESVSGPSSIEVARSGEHRPKPGKPDAHHPRRKEPQEVRGANVEPDSERPAGE